MSPCVYLGSRSLEKCEDMRLFGGVEREMEAVCEGRCIPSFSAGQEYSILENLIFQKKVTICDKWLFVLYPI